MTIDTREALTAERTIRRDDLARCAFSEAIECCDRYLRRAAERGYIEELVVGTEISVTLTEDFTDSVRRHDALEFSWCPRSALLPKGRALLTVRPHAPQGTQLQFSISYAPPLQAAGRWFDVAIGRHIAWLTCGLLLRRLRVESERCSS